MRVGLLAVAGGTEAVAERIEFPVVVDGTGAVAAEHSVNNLF